MVVFQVKLLQDSRRRNFFLFTNKTKNKQISKTFRHSSIRAFKKCTQRNQFWRLFSNYFLVCFDAPCLELSLKAKLEGIHYQTALFRCSLFRAFSKFIPLLHSIYSTGFDAPSLELSLNKVVRLFSLCIGIACFDAPLLELSLNHTKLAILSNLFAVSTLLNWSFRKMHTTKPILEAIFELFFSLLRYSLFGSFFK